MGKTYYTVAIRESVHHKWQIHFGDYERAVANDERDDVIHSGYAKYAKIVKSGDTQGEINLAMTKLNKDIK